MIFKHSTALPYCLMQISECCGSHSEVATLQHWPLSKSFTYCFEAQLEPCLPVCHKSCYGTDVCCALESFDVPRTCVLYSVAPTRVVQGTFICSLLTSRAAAFATARRYHKSSEKYLIKKAKNAPNQYVHWMSIRFVLINTSTTNTNTQTCQLACSVGAIFLECATFRCLDRCCICNKRVQSAATALFWLWSCAKKIHRPPLALHRSGSTARCSVSISPLELPSVYLPPAAVAAATCKRVRVVTFD